MQPLLRVLVELAPPPPLPPSSPMDTHGPSPAPPMQVAMQPLLRVMAELRKQDGPLGQLEIGPKIGEGGYGVVHQGEGWGRRGVWGGHQGEGWGRQG